MTDTDLLAEAVSARVLTALRSQNDLWSAAEIGAYLKVSERTVREHYAPLPDFPTPVRLPSKGGHGHPRWYESEVKRWAEKRREAA